MSADSNRGLGGLGRATGEPRHLAPNFLKEFARAFGGSQAPVPLPAISPANSGELFP